MKLIITESQALFLMEDWKSNIKATAAEKLGKVGSWASKKAANVVTDVGPEVANWAMQQQTGGESPLELSPEMAARFDDINIERDAPNLHKFLQAIKNPTAATGAANIFKTPEITSKLGLKDMIHPLGRKFKIESPFGKRNAPTAGASTNHSGVDFSVKSGSPVYAPLDGVITRAESVPPPDGCGGHVRIKHNKMMDSKFCHLKKWNVKKGDKVKKGDIIGYTGGGENDPHRGISTGPHLHYAIVINGEHIDPVGIQPGLA